jgi:hypothetical protein
MTHTEDNMTAQTHPTDLAEFDHRWLDLLD